MAQFPTDVKLTRSQ